MERDANQVPEATRCRSGCGFYGSPATDGLCSKCYKDALKRKQSTPNVTGRSSPTAPSPDLSTPSLSLSSSEIAAIATASTTVPVVSSSSQESSSSEQKSPLGDALADDSTTSVDNDLDAGADSSKDSAQKDKKKKNRCQTCRKKIGLTGFECRCGGLFCSLHRYSDKHDCTFNYRELGASEIRKNNPVVVGEKIQKI